MKVFKNPNLAIFYVLILGLGVWCNGEEEDLYAPMEKTEINALYSTIQGFVGNWWNGSDLYPDPCGWTPIQGVSCDIFNGFWYITSLNIGPIHENSLGCALNPQFKPEFFTLKHLKSFSLYNCFFSSSYQAQIPADKWELLLPSLESIEIRSNPSLIGQIPTQFGTLRNLQSLVLLENGLSGKLPANLGNLSKLRRLVLAGHQFIGHIQESYGGLADLLILDLSKNLLTGTLPLTFGELASLLKLDLSDNQLQGNIPEQIGNMKSLTLLDLSNNKLSGGLTKPLQKLTSLKELILSNNPIGGDLAKVEWQKVEGLTILELANTSLTGGIPESISALKSLRFLGLNGNALTGVISSKLENMASVSAMYLNGNNLTGELKFSESFYGKMGCRFGAWDNPNLCYPSVGFGSSGHVPFGVKKCHEKVLLDDGKSKLENGKFATHVTGNVVSMGISKTRIEGFLFVFMVETLMIVLVLCLLYK